MPKRSYRSTVVRRRLKPGKSPFYMYGDRPRPYASQRLRGKLSRARSIGLKNVRTGGLLGVETKYLDMAKTNTAIVAPTDASGAEYDPSSGCTGCLSAPAQGDTASNREGFKIAMKSIQVTGSVNVNLQLGQGSADIMPEVYIALVLDTQTNGAQLNSEDVFTNPGGVAYLAATPLRNMSYTERFKVLKIKKIRIPQASITYNGSQDTIVQNGGQFRFDMFKKLGGLPVKFTAGSTTANVSGVVDNSLHIIAYCCDTTMGPTISYNARLRFVG